MASMFEKYSKIIPHIIVESGAINTVADWALRNEYKNILVVFDTCTREVAGTRVVDFLVAADIKVVECCFPSDEPEPDEFSIGYLTAAYTPDIDLILGVGSGTINDICTFVGAKVGCPSAIVGTAPSMDGYASLGSAMLLDGLKVTPSTQCPVAVFCDIDILAAAPVNMIAAGLGDMLGKITAMADWRLANLLVSEPMPKDIVSIVETALDKIIKGAPHLPDRNPDVIKSVTEGLILSGIAMSLYGDSRPASGTEHHLAHFWEMRMIAEGVKPALHGIKVGIATIAGLVMWKELLALLSDSTFETFGSFERFGCVDNADKCASNYSEEIHRLYGRSAENILKTKNPGLSIDHIKANLKSIIDIAKSLPSPEEVAAMLTSVAAPVRHSKISLSDDTLRDSIIYARDRKKIYTIMQLLGDLGCLDDFAEHVSLFFAANALSGVKCYILDMDGTIYLGDKLFPYTLDFLNHLDKAGKDYIFYTNNSSQNSAYYISKLQKMGIPIAADKLYMSTHVLLEHLKNPVNNTGKTVFVAGTKALKDDFEAGGYILTEIDPDFVVLGFDTDMDYSRLTKLCDFVRAGLPYYGVHTDYNCPVEGGFIPDCGSLAAAVTASTGITPEFFGKPSRHTMDYIINKTGYKEHELCVIGDRLYTDIAIATGTKARCVLVLSGETKRNSLVGSKYVPDLIVKDLAELVAYIN
ncbi:MAG: iron-containing alcohol dehydrogenase [Oscillospiraceae bacterium]|nr:iron-containing alcohol dehydrogenase [Oscillospiraceae bacterium]